MPDGVRIRKLQDWINLKVLLSRADSQATGKGVEEKSWQTR